MAVIQLASQKDVEEALGRQLTLDETARVDAIIDKASELFRKRSGQQFTAGVSTDRVKVTANWVELVQRPVVSVVSVVDDDGHPIGFEQFDSRLHLTSCGVRFVRVTYTHGGEVPDLVRLTIADIARKVLSIDPKAVSGVTQRGETTGPFSEQYTYATWAQGGQTMLAPDDATIAASFRVKRYGSIVQGY